MKSKVISVKKTIGRILHEIGDDASEKSLTTHELDLTYLQGVPTSLGYAKCNVLKLRKVCERSELRLQKDPIKKEISNINDM